MSTRRLLACLAALVLGGCAGRAPMLLASFPPSPATDCGQRFEPREAVPLSADPMQPTRHRIGAVGGICAGVALFRLPRFRREWTLDVASAFDGQRLYAPRVQLLDEDGRVRRELPFDRFALRGERLQATLFFGDDTRAERYLRLLPAREVLGQSGRRLVSSSFVIPLINTTLPLVYVQGIESGREYVHADAGVVHLAAQDGRPRSRRAPLHDLARGEFAALVR